MRERDRGRRTDGLAWGLLLIGMGVCFMLMMYDVLPSDFLYGWWALFVIAAGVGSLVTARSPRSLGSGVTTLGIGCWLLVATNGWYGLGWARSWPLALVAVGLGTLTRALAALWWRESEVRHEG